MNTHQIQNESKREEGRILPSKGMQTNAYEKKVSRETIALSKNFSFEKPAKGEPSQIQSIVNETGFIDSYKNESLFLTAEGKQMLGIKSYHQKKHQAI
ncbi:hypothetical protein CN918_26025 [Priestia megaterium]|nr:hypothetical protein CN918_26025 [Priestia megaterium]